MNKLQPELLEKSQQECLVIMKGELLDECLQKFMEESHKEFLEKSQKELKEECIERLKKNFRKNLSRCSERTSESILRSECILGNIVRKIIPRMFGNIPDGIHKDTLGAGILAGISQPL